MSLTASILGKDVYNLTLGDLEAFFSTEQEETSVLEFKSGETGLEGIYKEVAAFLNTEGGILIIGAPREKTIAIDKKEKRVCQGSLTPSKIRNQDDLLRSIASNISPAPYKIKAKELDFDQGKVYILEIPQSLTPPHQVTNEGKYYIRLERDAKAAPHGIVEALFFRRQKPNLEIDIEVKLVAIDNGATLHEIAVIYRNDSLESAENVGLILDVTNVSQVIDARGTRHVNLNSFKYQGQEDFANAVLVKGLTASLKVRATFIKSVAEVTCTYWCKGVQAETKTVILEFTKQEIITKVLCSKNDTEAEKDAFWNYYDSVFPS